MQELVFVVWLKIVGRKMQGISSIFFCLFLGVAAEGFFSQAFLEGGDVVHGGLWKYRDFLALPTEKSSLDYFHFCPVPTVEEKELSCESRTHSPLPQELSTKVELQA